MKLLIGLAIVGVILLIGVVCYNTLLRYKNTVIEARSGIDVQMKEKGNIVKNLLAIIKKQQAFETETLEKIVKARQGLDSNNTEDKMTASDNLTHLVNFVAEQYPVLGTNDSYMEFMGQYGEVERKITYARTRYNATVTEYNTRQQSVPYVFFKKIGGFQIEKVYELDVAEFKIIDNLDIGEM